MNNSHSRLAPSSAARRMACPGSREMVERYGRNEESEAAREGTLAHECADKCLNEKDITGYSTEMVEGAKYYRDTVLRFCQNQKSTDTFTEHLVCMDEIHPAMWGTIDAFLINFNETKSPIELHIFDYKYGFTPVQAFENWQLIAYASGVLMGNVIKDIYLHIVQPRDYVSPSPHKMWHLTLDEFKAYEHRLRISEALAMSPNAPLRVSEQCKYCPARHACPALRDAAMGAATHAFAASGYILTPDEMGAELKLLHEAQEILSFRISALETEVQMALERGERVGGYELKPTTSRMTWTIPIKEVIELGALFNVRLEKKDVLTPTQAIKAGLKEETVIRYSERKQSIKLSKVNVVNSRAVFNQT